MTLSRFHALPILSAALIFVACADEPADTGDATASDEITDTGTETDATIEAAETAGEGEWTEVDCNIATAEMTAYEGRCLYAADGDDGSFAIRPVGADVFMDEVTSISVTIYEGDTANVRGLTTAGINSNWGDANPEAGDSNCWAGVDFTICVDA
ncbi:MAG: hypothetical protein RLN87_10775 [Parasphingopyxis sp.]|uniref:hypothetical protein n=1 Tax=Parasphingopyxis sp. TaxID=1920299 RepID=UPI0032EC9FDE